MQDGEKNPWLHLDSFKPAAIRFMLELLQESARHSVCFLPANFIYLYPQKSWRVTYYLQGALWNLMDIILFIRLYSLEAEGL